MDEEQNQFQQDLLESVREMKTGRALPPAQMKKEAVESAHVVVSETSLGRVAKTEK